MEGLRRRRAASEQTLFLNVFDRQLNCEFNMLPASLSPGLEVFTRFEPPSELAIASSRTSFRKPHSHFAY